MLIPHVFGLAFVEEDVKNLFEATGVRTQIDEDIDGKVAVMGEDG